MNETQRDRLLTRYLLGDLPEEDADRLEMRLLAESELFETAEALEGELIDDYLRGDLEPRERELFERNLLRSERVIHRFVTARALSRVAQTVQSPAPRAAVATTEPKPSLWERLFPAPARLAWAATLVTTVAAGLFAVQSFELQDQLDRMAAIEESDELALPEDPASAIDDTTLEALERDLEAQEQANRELGEQLADTRQLLVDATELAPGGERTRGPRGGRGSASGDGGRRDATNLVTRYLGQANRSAGDGQIEPLVLASDDRLVRLQLQLDYRIGTTDLVARITREGAQVYEGRDLVIDGDDPRRALAILELPRGIFFPGTHEIRLTSTNGDEERFYELEVTEDA